MTSSISQKTIHIYKASAGSGKTYRLAYDYVSLLFQNRAEHYPHRRTLAVTFTNKATDEMKRRIIVELFALATSSSAPFFLDLQRDYPHLTPQAIQEQARFFLTELLHDYSGFNISTIDKFFQQIVRAFTREIGLQGNFGVELDKDKILQIAIDNMLFELDRDENKQLLDWLEDYAKEQLDNNQSWDISKNMLKLGNELFKESYIQHLADISDKLHDKIFLKEFRGQLRAIITDFEQELTMLCNKALDIINRYHLNLTDFSGGSRSFMLYLDYNRLKSKDFEVTDTFKNAVADVTKWYTKDSPHVNSITEAYHQGLQACVERIAFIDKTRYLSAKIALKNIYMMGILSDIGAQIKRYCDENNMFLISSTTEFLNKIMAGCDTPFIYEKTGVNIRHYMIDEFQDTSQLQWDNFKPLLTNSLAENNQNLVVGDVKQSIYRFRNSDWSLLQNGIEEAFPNRVDITSLETNWRSAKRIIAFNNTFFKLAPLLLVNQFADTKEQQIIQDVYANVLQKSAKNDDYGRIRVDFIVSDPNKPWKTIALERLVDAIEELKAAHYPLSKITILVRWNKDATLIADYLLEQNYEVISSEALLIGNAPSVRLIVAMMRYFIAPEDALNRALIEALISQNGTNRTRPFQSFTDIELWRQQQFGEQYQAIESLKNQPLFQLTEGLIQQLNLYNSENTVFLQAFQDEVFNYASHENADINGFLNYWGEFSNKKYLAASETQEAIRIMTIHKSKGLEFDAVIIPFCDWELDSRANSSILWCKPHANEQPFAQLPVIPLNYSNKLDQTIFAKDYRTEKLHCYIDTLNTAYVAFTRAKNELIIFAPKEKAKGKIHETNKSISSLLEQLFSDSQQVNTEEYPVLNLSNYYKDNEQAIVGEMTTYINHDQVTQSVSLNYNSTDINKHLKLHYTFNDTGSDRRYGLLMHNILSQIESVTDVTPVINKCMLAGTITKDEVTPIRLKIMEIISLEAVEQWFSGYYKILNEAEIIAPTGESYRPDRLMIHLNEVIVVDYKFGQQKDSKYHRQVTNYMRLIRGMGYDVKGYIYYTLLGEIETV